MTQRPQIAGKTPSTKGVRPSKRRVEEAEPAAELGLDRQLAFELGLQLELLRVVSLLVLAGRHERPEGAALVPVDEVHGMLPAVELEQRREQLLSEALLLEALSHRVNSRDLIFELRVADDDPAVPERVVAPLELRTRRSGNRVQKLLDVALGAHELTGGERLEADPARSGGREPLLGVD